MINFLDINYLKCGTDKQQKAYSVLTQHSILLKLQQFDPILTGTIPLSIDIDTSDLDIVCYWDNKKFLITELQRLFGNEKMFRIKEKVIAEEICVIAYFVIDDFEIEIFGQNIPSQKQAAYKHMLIEYALLSEKGDTFRNQIIELKKRGYKTEPAFAMLLDVEGDPYKGLLEYNSSIKATEL